MKIKIISLIAATFLTACAQSPDSIAPVPLGDAYAASSCSSARAHLSMERSNLAILSAQQQAAVSGDAVGVLLVGIPVSSLSGNDKAGLIATSKGKILALESRISRC